MSASSLNTSLIHSHLTDLFHLESCDCSGPAPCALCMVLFLHFNIDHKGTVFCTRLYEKRCYSLYIGLNLNDGHMDLYIVVSSVLVLAVVHENHFILEESQSHQPDSHCLTVLQLLHKL